MMAWFEVILYALNEQLGQVLTENANLRKKLDELKAFENQDKFINLLHVSLLRVIVVLDTAFYGLSYKCSNLSIVPHHFGSFLSVKTFNPSVAIQIHSIPRSIRRPAAACDPYPENVRSDRPPSG